MAVSLRTGRVIFHSKAAGSAVGDTVQAAAASVAGFLGIRAHGHHERADEPQSVRDTAQSGDDVVMEVFFAFRACPRSGGRCVWQERGD